MSAAAGAAPAPIAAGRPRHRRPSTLTVLRWELRKLGSQKRTYLGLGIAVLFPLIFVVAQNLRAHHPHQGGDVFAGYITQSGLATPVLILLWTSVFLLPLIAALVAGDVVATEDGNGTLKTILTRSVDRRQVILAKTLTAMLYAAAGTFTTALVATVAGVASWGFNDVITFSGTIVFAPEGAAADRRRLCLLPRPTGSRRKHRRAALDADAQQCRRGCGHPCFHAPARVDQADPRPGRRRTLPAYQSISGLAGIVGHAH